MELATGNDGLSTGAIVGIVIGAVALVGIGGFCVYFFVIRKRKHTGAMMPPEA